MSKHKIEGVFTYKGNSELSQHSKMEMTGPESYQLGLGCQRWWWIASGESGHHGTPGFLPYPQDKQKVRAKILVSRHESAQLVILRTPGVD